MIATDNKSIRIENVAETGSTSADLVARLNGGERVGEGYWLVADRQLQGRGRRGRPWLDAPGNFMGSTVVRLDPAGASPASLSFVAALAVYAAVSGKLAQPGALTLKWPNDVLLSGAKLCGILLERQGDQAVVGIGVNLAAAPRLEDRQTLSMADKGVAPDRDFFAADLAQNFAQEVDRWRQFGTGPMFARWQAAAHARGTPLSVHDSLGQRVSGHYDGLDADGALRLALGDGTTRIIHAGDVTIGSEG